MTNGPEHGRRRASSARRQRRLLRWIVAVVAVFGATAGGSEIIVRQVATARVTTAVADRLHAPPTVDIGGGPILPQVVSGRLAQVSLSARDATLGRFTPVDLSAHLTGVHLPRAGRPASINHATVTAEISRSQVADLLARRGLPQAGGSLPFGLTVTGVNPTSGGFEITFEASDIPLG